LRWLAEQVYVPYFCFGTDVFLSLESVVPLVPVGAKKKMVVIHDIHVIRHLTHPERYPEDYSWQYKTWAAITTSNAVRSSEVIVAISKFTARELQDVFEIPSHLIITIPNGIDHSRFHPTRESGAVEGVKMRYGLPPSFYLFVGPYSRKKNLRLVIEAYASRELDENIFLPVVVVGNTRRNKLYKDTLMLLERTNGTELFRFLGFVPDEDLPFFYKAARAFIYPSLYEGFGLPALEAMACGTPVIASNETSIPEVVADSAILFDPAHPKSLIDALREVNNEHTRKNLIEKGFRRAKSFSWERTAKLMVEAVLD
jgi:glycosyltransferase involved in cell wall biosynthesis